jgi:hypothetical protein
MHRLRPRYVCVFLAGLAPAAALAGMSVNAQVATEGRFAIYIGAPNGSDLELVAANAGAPQAVGPLRALVPQRVTFELPDGKCIYIATWGVRRPHAGLIGEFLFNGMPVYSGDPAWEVYYSPLRLGSADHPPIPQIFSDEIVAATRRFLWKKAAKLVGNGAGPVSMIGQLDRSAAWMWLPAASPKAPPPAVPVNGLLIFRIAPNDIWPEIELNYTQNLGLGPVSGIPRSSGGERYSSFAGGGGSSGGGGSGDLAAGGGAFGPIGAPPMPLDPPNSFATPASSPPGNVTSDPIVPSPRDTTPVASSDDDYSDHPPTNTTSDNATKPKPPTDPPPAVPEPAALALLTTGLALLRRR